MSTFGQIARGAFGVLGDSGINGSVAVAAAALVVVLTIVVVFVMVLRSNGSASKTAHGLGYDAQRGPLGQPQNDPDAAWGGGRPSTPADASPWGAPQRSNAAANGWGSADVSAQRRPGCSGRAVRPDGCGRARLRRWRPWRWLGRTERERLGYPRRCSARCRAVGRTATAADERRCQWLGCAELAEPTGSTLVGCTG